MKRFFGFIFTVAILGPVVLLAAPVLMISVDGLQPADVMGAKERGLKIPALQALMTQGAYATGVKNVLPTVTFPNHTTLITGVTPAMHGISNNKVFDPLGASPGSLYWFAGDIRVPTLWDQVHANKKTVASIKWPVSVGAPSIDFNIPDYKSENSAEDLKLLRALSTPGLIDRLENETGVSGMDIINEMKSDEARAKYAAKLIEARRPELTTLHLSSLDATQHDFGPESKKAFAVLESLDSVIGELIATARKAMPDVVIAIVSDHGFVAIKHDVNLLVPFVEAGLVTIDLVTKKVKTYKAIPWAAGGSAAIVLANPNDDVTKKRVSALLARLAANPKNGIAKVIDKSEIERRGAAKEASFFVDFALGYEMIDYKTTGPLVTQGTLKGMHGYFPEHKEMRATFIIAGPGVNKKGSLGEIDMRDIAPTLAKLMGVSLPAATGNALF